jgi:hypothetical protein
LDFSFVRRYAAGGAIRRVITFRPHSHSRASRLSLAFEILSQPLQSLHDRSAATRPAQLPAKRFANGGAHNQRIAFRIVQGISAGALVRVS